MVIRGIQGDQDNIGGLIVRIGLCGPLYGTNIKEPPKIVSVIIKALNPKA